MNGQVDDFAAEPADMRKLADMDRELVGQSAQIGIVVAESGLPLRHVAGCGINKRKPIRFTQLLSAASRRREGF